MVVMRDIVECNPTSQAAPESDGWDERVDIMPADSAAACLLGAALPLKRIEPAGTRAVDVCFVRHECDFCREVPAEVESGSYGD